MGSIISRLACCLSSWKPDCPQLRQLTLHTLRQGRQRLQAPHTPQHLQAVAVAALAAAAGKQQVQRRQQQVQVQGQLMMMLTMLF